MLKLYYAPGSCSISPHITLSEAHLPHELHRVDLMRGNKTDDGVELASINSKGYVPVLVLETDEQLTEGPAIVQYLADLRPGSNLAPPPGTFARIRLMEWLNFIATELHKGLGPLSSKVVNDEYRKLMTEKFADRLAYVEQSLANKEWLMGQFFTVADGYLFYALRAWHVVLRQELGPTLAKYFVRVGDRPMVRAALAAEGFKLKA